MLEKKKIAITSDSLSEFLHQIESSFANAFQDASPEELSTLERSVKGFETLSFDWAICLSKYIIDLESAECKWSKENATFFSVLFGILRPQHYTYLVNFSYLFTDTQEGSKSVRVISQIDPTCNFPTLRFIFSADRL